MVKKYKTIARIRDITVTVPELEPAAFYFDTGPTTTFNPTEKQPLIDM